MAVQSVNCCGDVRPVGKSADLDIKGTGDDEVVTVHNFLPVVNTHLMCGLDKMFEAMATCKISHRKCKSR